MAEPVRIQLSRRKGFDLQATSKSLNGLPAVNVARPSRWGNPFKVGEDHSYYSGPDAVAATAEQCVELFRRVSEIVPVAGIAQLRGKNLACWCKIVDRHGNYAPCHADVLLSLANQITCEEVRDENLRRAKGEAER